MDTNFLFSAVAVRTHKYLYHYRIRSVLCSNLSPNALHRISWVSFRGLIFLTSMKVFIFDLTLVGRLSLSPKVQTARTPRLHTWV